MCLPNIPRTTSPLSHMPRLTSHSLMSPKKLYLLWQSSNLHVLTKSILLPIPSGFFRTNTQFNTVLSNVQKQNITSHTTITTTRQENTPSQPDPLSPALCIATENLCRRKEKAFTFRVLSKSVTQISVAFF